MKPKPLLATLAALTLSLGNLLANVGVFVEYYEVEHSALPTLLREYQQEPDASGLLKRVQELEKTGNAQLVESSYITTRPGQRTKIESAREFIYPTEWDPAETPQTLTGPIDPQTVIMTPTTPTAFDVRNIGHTLELEPNFDPSETYVSLNLAPELVTFQGLSSWGQGVSETQQPLFDAAITQTNIIVKSGGCELFGTFKRSAPSSTKRLLGFISPTVMKPISRGEFNKLRAAPTGDVKKAPALAPDDDIPTDDPFGIAQDEVVPPPPTQISLITEYIEVDAGLARQFARELNQISDATAIRLRLDGIIAQGSARVLETSTILTQSGQSSKTTSVREFIYPTEFGPPQIPQTMHGAIDPELDMIISVTASAFDVRNLGLEIEIEANASFVATNRGEDGGEYLISLNMAPSLVRLAGETPWGKGPSTSKQPLFETMKFATNVQIPDATSLLLAMHSLETARAGQAATAEEQEAVNQRRVLVFVTAKVKQLK